MHALQSFIQRFVYLAGAFAVALAATLSVAPSWGQGLISNPQPAPSFAKRQGNPQTSFAEGFQVGESEQPQGTRLPADLELPTNPQSLKTIHGVPYDPMAGKVPKFTPSFWQGQMVNRVPIGTVLCGILEDNLSSDESKVGDIFSIRLEDGYFQGDKEVIPRQSRIIGTVVAAVPAKLMTHGIPGSLKVSLQTLVFPDGRNTRIYGHIDHNPNMDLLEDPAKSQASDAIAYYPRAALGSVAQVGRVLSGRIIGIKPGVRSRGLNFVLKRGEVLAIRLNRSADLTVMSPPPASFIPPGLNGPQGAAVPASSGGLGMPGLNGPQPAALPPSCSGSLGMPGLSSATGLPATKRGLAKASTVGGARHSEALSPAPNAGWKLYDDPNDPNKIFDVPLGAKPKVQLQEPF